MLKKLLSGIFGGSSGQKGRKISLGDLGDAYVRETKEGWTLDVTPEQQRLIDERNHRQQQANEDDAVKNLSLPYAAIDARLDSNENSTVFDDGHFRLTANGIWTEAESPQDGFYTEVNGFDRLSFTLKVPSEKLNNLQMRPVVEAYRQELIEAALGEAGDIAYSPIDWKYNNCVMAVSQFLTSYDDAFKYHLGVFASRIKILGILCSSTNQAESAEDFVKRTRPAFESIKLTKGES